MRRHPTLCGSSDIGTSRMTVPHILRNDLNVIEHLDRTSTPVSGRLSCRARRRVIAQSRLILAVLAVFLGRQVDMCSVVEMHGVLTLNVVCICVGSGLDVPQCRQVIPDADRWRRNRSLGTNRFRGHSTVPLSAAVSVADASAPKPPTARRRADTRGLDALGDQHVPGPPGTRARPGQQWIGTGLRDSR